ncbi:hypothetical protein Dd586_3981 [Dickeya parazeae Ech586]|uniref:Uncharacterized protein n=1 Tax=Dickeya zeae (strain Ech586) TaxID=590409 RepID=D2BZ00_DICZ5|nr:hypothetical protein [Dickeya parazeae]ACZ78807.1 hypothetical protein Dd586_3981 [Dickeya parazeae Ech586]
MGRLNIRLLDIGSLDDGQLIDLTMEENGSLKSLFKGRVDFQLLIEWFLDNEEDIKSLEIPVGYLTDTSIAEGIHSIYENLDVDNDEVVDKMFDYRSSHCLRFASRGTDFPEIYIGKNGVRYEISIFNECEQWRYFFDIDDFFDELKLLS